MQLGPAYDPPTSFREFYGDLGYAAAIFQVGAYVKPPPIGGFWLGLGVGTGRENRELRSAGYERIFYPVGEEYWSVEAGDSWAVALNRYPIYFPRPRVPWTAPDALVAGYGPDVECDKFSRNPLLPLPIKEAIQDPRWIDDHGEGVIKTAPLDEARAIRFINLYQQRQFINENRNPCGGDWEDWNYDRPEFTCIIEPTFVDNVGDYVEIPARRLAVGFGPGDPEYEYRPAGLGLCKAMARHVFYGHSFQGPTHLYGALFVEDKEDDAYYDAPEMTRATLLAEHSISHKEYQEGFEGVREVNANDYSRALIAKPEEILDVLHGTPRIPLEVKWPEPKEDWGVPRALRLYDAEEGGELWMELPVNEQIYLEPGVGEVVYNIRGGDVPLPRTSNAPYTRLSPMGADHGE